MLKPTQKLAIYMEDNLNSSYGKMGFGIMRYSKNPIVCVIDSVHAGKTVIQASEALPFNFPIVANVDQAAQLGAEVLVLGTAPSGGQVPAQWGSPLEKALHHNMCIVNGLHDKLNDRYGHLLNSQQWIWDVRQPAFTPDIATAQAANLNNKRVLMVGTDMAIGKMTVGLEIYNWICQNHPHIKTDFLATGQIGITVTGKGIPLDAYKVDHACGAVESIVMDAAHNDIIFVEGQGSLLHPGSSATLSLMRGSCATHLIMCHRAKMDGLRKPDNIKMPPLKEFIELNEALASACGALTKATTIGIALKTSKLNDQEACFEIAKLEDETGLPVQDVVRYGAAKIGASLIT